MKESLRRPFKFCPVKRLSTPSKVVHGGEKIPHMEKYIEWVSENSDSSVKDTESSSLVQIVSHPQYEPAICVICRQNVIREQCVRCIRHVCLQCLRFCERCGNDICLTCVRLGHQCQPRYSLSLGNGLSG